MTGLCCCYIFIRKERPEEISRYLFSARLLPFRCRKTLSYPTPFLETCCLCSAGYSQTQCNKKKLKLTASLLPVTSFPFSLCCFAVKQRSPLHNPFMSMIMIKHSSVAVAKIVWEYFFSLYTWVTQLRSTRDFG